MQSPLNETSDAKFLTQRKDSFKLFLLYYNKQICYRNNINLLIKRHKDDFYKSKI